MNPRRPVLLAVTATALLSPLPVVGQDATADAARDPVTSDQVVPAHVHIRHVAETFRGTPNRQGLLPTAMAEAEIAQQHATLAARDPSDLEAMKRHAAHVIHALDPDEVETGPGLGYGMIEAASRAAHYVDLAMASEGAGDAILTHGAHVSTAARSAIAAATEAVEVADSIVDADTAEEAAELLVRLTSLTDTMINGVDADGDGRIGWQEGEGGLAQASQHLGLLMRGEGIGD